MIKGIYQLRNEDIKGVYRDALLSSFRSWTDELQSGNAERTCSQMPICKSIDLCIASKKRHLTIIKREEDYFSEKPFYEFGMSTMGRPDYFVWICVSIEESEKLFEKYKISYK